MMKIWSMKQQQQQAENATAAGPKKKKATAAQLRVQKGWDISVGHGGIGRTDYGEDIAELALGSTMQITFPDPDDILHFLLTIEPDEGLYKSGSFVLDIKAPAGYPHEPPKVRCTQKIYHPNLDLAGNVCLNILREDWKPVLNLNAVIVGLQFLFLEPNANDPLNKEAAEDLKSSRENFKRNVRTSMSGGMVKGESFDRVLVSK